MIADWYDAPAIDLTNGKSPSLRWSHRAGTEGDPVNLVLHDRRDRPVLLGRDPQMARAPLAETPQLRDLGMRFRACAFDRQLERVVNAHIGADTRENPRGLVGSESRKRASIVRR